MANDIIDKSFYLTSLFSDIKSDSKWTENEIKTVLMLFGELSKHKIYIPDFYDSEESFETQKFKDKLSAIPSEYNFSRNEFAKYTSVSPAHLSREINKVRMSLVKKVIHTPHPLEPDDTESGESITWFSKISYSNKTGNIFIKVNEAALDRLIAFVKYTKVDFSKVVCLRNSNAIYYYLFFKIMRDASKYMTLTMTIDEFKEKINLKGKYQKISHLKEKVIDVIVQEINEHTELNFSYELIKEGRAFKKIKFDFDYKNIKISHNKKLDADDSVRNNIVEHTYDDECSIFEAQLSKWGVRARTIVEWEDTYSLGAISESIEITKQAIIDGKIKGTPASYFKGVLENTEFESQRLFEEQEAKLKKEEEAKLNAEKLQALETEFDAIQKDVNLYDEELARYLSAKTMGATIELSSKLNTLIENLLNIDAEKFNGYKSKFAILEIGYFDYKLKKEVRPNIYNLLRILAS